jgi:hypothetical protein
MKIAIISDIHDNIMNLARCLNWCQKENVDSIICCGDMTDSETLEFLAEEFKKKIYLAKGNMEIYDPEEVKKYKNIEYLGEFGRIEINNKFIGIGHEPEHANDILDLGPCEIIFCGHTHKPWQEKRDNTLIVNAGTVSGTFYKACFASWDIENNKLDLHIMDLMT